MKAQLVGILSVLCVLSCVNPVVDISVAPSNDAGTGVAVVVLPEIPDGFLAKTQLTGARLELMIYGARMDTMLHQWAVGSMPIDPVVIDGIPAGSARVFEGRLVDSRETLTHAGQVACDIGPGDTVFVTLRLLAQTGTAVVCIEIEGLPSSCEPTPSPVPDVTDGLVAHYTLDGHGRDASGMGNHGTVNGAVATADRFGNRGGALLFDGDDYVEAPHSASLDCERAVSLTVWAQSSVAMARYMADGVIAQKGFASEEAYGLSWHTATQSMIGIYRNHWEWDTDHYADLDGGLHSYEPLDTAWHFWAIVFDSQVLTMYRDGWVVGRIAAYPGTLADSPLRIGAQSKSLARYWRGAIDEVRVYNRPLSLEELRLVMRQ